MASAVADATAILDEVVSKPPPGVVLPPKDIRAIVEKTAGYVARNGPVFEDRIRQKELNNPKFSFLGAQDPYNSFYVWRLSEVREGRGTAVSAGRVGEEPAKVPEKPKGPEPPPEFHFSARMPNISAQDLEVVKLTALFVAKNGRSFATALAQRESNNSQFDFLRPQHSLYQFFSRLIDQYSALLTGGDVEGGKPEKQRVEELQQNMDNKFNVLERAKKRGEWVKFQEEQKVKKEEEAEEERLSYAQIDWHDFLVVETVIFSEADDQTDLPPPTSLSDLQTASLDQKAMMSLAPHSMRIEEAMPTDEDYYAQAGAVQVPGPYAPGQPVNAYRSAQEEEEDARIRERASERERAQQAQAAAMAAPGPMRIREATTIPRALARRKNVPTAQCPNCKQVFPMDELEQHMKIELLDPQWRDQRAKAESRYATTNLSTQDVANNLKRLASQRQDVFDPVSGQPISEEEQARRKKAALAYDGNVDGENRGPRPPLGQPMNIEDQIKSIHKRFGQ